MPSFQVRRAVSADLEDAISALGEAFAGDPLMQYFFAGSPDGIRATAMEFFSLLLQARIALGMPAYVLQHGDDVVGVVMGYDTSRAVWPAPLADEWRQFEASLPDLAAHFAAYDAISEAHKPVEDHYYLGVIGLHPSLQGNGAGKAMLEAFCDVSLADPCSHGVYLETSSPSSLQFYYRNGFELRGEGLLEKTPLWCVYRPT